MRSTLIAAAAGLLLAGCATSSSAPVLAAGAAETSASTAPSGGARAKAEALIAQVSGADLFENVTRGERAQVRHRRSGLVCTFPEDAPGQHLNIYPQPLPRGEDVGCQLSTGEHFHTLIATRFPTGAPTLDQALEGSVGLIRRQYPTLREFEGPSADVTMSRPDLRPAPPHRSASFVVPLNGRDHYTRVSVAMVNGWVFKQRYTAPLAAAVEADLLAGLAFSEALLRFSNPGVDLDAPPPATSRPAIAA